MFNKKWIWLNWLNWNECWMFTLLRLGLVGISIPMGTLLFWICMFIYYFISWVMCLGWAYVAILIWRLPYLLHLALILFWHWHYFWQSYFCISGGDDLHGLGWLLPSTCSPCCWVNHCASFALTLFPLHEFCLIFTIYSSSTYSKCKRGWCL